MTPEDTPKKQLNSLLSPLPLLLALLLRLLIHFLGLRLLAGTQHTTVRLGHFLTGIISFAFHSHTRAQDKITRSPPVTVGCADDDTFLLLLQPSTVLSQQAGLFLLLFLFAQHTRIVEYHRCSRILVAGMLLARVRSPEPIQIGQIQIAVEHSIQGGSMRAHAEKASSFRYAKPRAPRMGDAC